MSTVIKFIKFWKPIQIYKSPAVLHPSVCLHHWRGFADKPTSDATSKQVMVQGADKEERIRVRRARPADVPRVLRFVRENALITWPSSDTPNSNFHLILGDYISRALAQGHSMLAEQQEIKQGWSQIRGLAISATVCPWDAMMLEKWARCIQCNRSKQLVHFTAHCLQAPALHEKYKVHNILQVILIVPPDVPKSSEIVQLLAKNTIKRGREVGLTVLRFDVTHDPVAKALEGLNLVKEWEQSFNLLPNALNERKLTTHEDSSSGKEKDLSVNDKENKQEGTPQNKGHFISVYTATNHITKI